MANEETQNKLLRLKEELSKVEFEIVEKDKKLVNLIQEDSTKNELILALKQKNDAQEKEIEKLITKLTELTKYNPKKLNKSIKHREEKIKILSEKINEKIRHERKYEKIVENTAVGSKKKDELITTISFRNEKYEEENNALRNLIAKKEIRIKNLMNKFREIEEKESSNKKEAITINKLLKKINEERLTSTEIISELRNTKDHLIEKGKIISAFEKQDNERKKIFYSLNIKLEKAHQKNKELFREVEELRLVLNNKTRAEAGAEAEAILARKKHQLIEKKMSGILEENTKLRKDTKFIEETYSSEINGLKNKIKEIEKKYNEETERYNRKVKHLLNENVKKEIDFKEKIDFLRRTVEKQNYLISEKEKKEKEVMEEISTKFTDIFALREEIQKLSSNENEEFEKFLNRDEFIKEEVNNIVSLIKTGLNHNTSLENIKSSLISSGYNISKIEKAMNLIEKK